MLLPAPGFARPGDSYAETWTDQRASAYTEDTNVWVYTSAFAERFGMPEKWMDDGIEGALAAAWRVEWPGIRTRFPHKGPDVSKPESYCFLDVYVSSSAKIQWLTEPVMDKRYLPPSSPAYPVPQEEQDKKKRAFETHEVGIPHTGGVGEIGTQKKDLGGVPHFANINGTSSRALPIFPFGNPAWHLPKPVSGSSCMPMRIPSGRGPPGPSPGGACMN